MLKTDRQALVVVDDINQVPEITKRFEEQGIQTHVLSCTDVSEKIISDLNIDFILVDRTSTSQVCKNSTAILCDEGCAKVVPVFALVKDNEKDIQSALYYGAVDYFTSKEDIKSVLQKINIVLTQDEKFSNTEIDITPIEPAVDSAGLKVYIIEDDPLLRNLLSMRMDKSSFVYEFSSDGNLTVPAVRQFKPSVIVLDLMLPGKSGFEVLEEIKAEEDLKDIPVIVFSNRDGQEDRRKAESLGAAGFYVKAMTDLAELIETIEGLAKDNKANKA